MLNINLPIINENKIVIQKFKVIVKNKTYIIENVNNNFSYWVPVFSRYYGFTKSLVNFPLKLEVFNNQYLLMINSIEVSFYQDYYQKFENYDFYSSLLNKINKINHCFNPNVELKYFKSSNLLSYPKKIINKMINVLNKKLDLNNEKINLEDILTHVYDHYMTLKCLFIILAYQYSLNPNSDSTFLSFIKKKKINKYNKNLFRCYFYQIYFNSEERISILDILEKKNKLLLLKDLSEGKKYYLKKKNSDNKFFLIKIKNINDKIITLINNQTIYYNNYDWFNSVPTINFDLNNIFFKINKSFYDIELLKYNTYSDIFNLNGLERFLPVILKEEKIFPTVTILKKFKMNRIMSKTIGNINLSQIDDSSKLVGFDIYRNIDQIETSYLSNKFLVNKDINEIIFYFEEYFKKILYPIKFNRRALDPYFDKLLYLSLLCKDIIFVESGSKIYLNNQIIQIIPIKMKNFFTNILKYLYLLIRDSDYDNFIYNYKFYQDTIYQTTLKVILTNEDSMSHKILKSLLGNKCYLIDEILINWRKTFYLRNIASVLEWNNIKNYLDYLKYLLDNNDLIFFNNKLNKSIFSSDIDDNLRKIIICPFKMYQYLTKKIDFIKWAKFLGKSYNNLYNSAISLSSEDISLLGELIYYLYDVDVQIFSNKKYQRLLDFAKKNHKLIVKNGRINLKIKEKLGKMKCNYNLGFLAKHITYNNNCDTISLSDTSKETPVDNSEIIELRYKLSIITKKYYKYKAKYLQNKDSLGLISNNSTSNFSAI